MAKPKYNDYQTRKQQYKQVEKAEGQIDTSRKNRREKERSVFKFSCKVYPYLKKECWDSMPLNIREDIYRAWHLDYTVDINEGYYGYIMRKKPKNNFLHESNRDGFKNWLFKQIKIRVDKSTYRDIIINNLLK